MSKHNKILPAERIDKVELRLIGARFDTLRQSTSPSRLLLVCEFCVRHRFVYALIEQMLNFISTTTACLSKRIITNLLVEYKYSVSFFEHLFYRDRPIVFRALFEQ